MLRIQEVMTGEIYTYLEDNSFQALMEGHVSS
jgi:hypothetical protein